MRLIEQIDLRYDQIGVRPSWLRCGENLSRFRARGSER
jgi:hypothetical protein